MNVALVRPSFSSLQLEDLFNRCFSERENTRLIGGEAEPLYVPAADEYRGERCTFHRLFYREDYFASALHEISHWCIAGAARRQLRDFGYWYAPDGRNAEQQLAFQAVEVRPQALEWCLSQACGYPFQVSLDNLEASETARRSDQAFSRAVVAEGLRLQREGLPPRAYRFFSFLAQHFGRAIELADLQFPDSGQ